MRSQGIAALLLASLLLIGSVRGADQFQIDPAHAFVTFTVSHFAGKARGSFSDVSGQITYDEKDMTLHSPFVSECASFDEFREISETGEGLFA